MTSNNASAMNEIVDCELCTEPASERYDGMNLCNKCYHDTLDAELQSYLDGVD